MCLSWRVDTPQTKPDRELIVSTSNDGVANVPYRQERRAQRGRCGRCSLSGLVHFIRQLLHACEGNG